MRPAVRSVVYSLALLASLLTPAASQAQSAEVIASDNIEFVANLTHASAEGERSRSNGGSDIEFVTLDVEVEGADGEIVTETRDFAIAGTLNVGMQIYDITDPRNTYRAAVYGCDVTQGDIQVFRQTDAAGVTRTYATFTSEDSTGNHLLTTRCAKELVPGATAVSQVWGTYVVEITDPFKPVGAAHIPVIEGSHNGTVHPSGNYFYNSNSSLIINPVTSTVLENRPETTYIEYYDISNLAGGHKPERLGQLQLPPTPLSLGAESHDISFNAAGTRAYSAALSQGVIIDTTNPATPKLLTVFVDPTINVWHQAEPIVVGDRTLLVVEDEQAGAAAGVACPQGGVHVFDITGELERAPVKVGYWNIDDVYATGTASCTMHVFRLYPEAGLMTIAAYRGGVRVVDLNGLAGLGLGDSAVLGDPTGTYGEDPMVQIGYARFANSNAWSAKSPRIEEDGSFWLFANDITRGLDVFRFTAGNAAAEAEAARAGTWLSATEAAAQLRPTQRGLLAPFCLLPR